MKLLFSVLYKIFIGYGYKLNFTSDSAWYLFETSDNHSKLFDSIITLIIFPYLPIKQIPKGTRVY